ncbi:MAG: TrpB-like pyridoxal phosphate-dependent enzyme [Propionibacteriaceae bacterium]|nr:TrpB-like pyridoxal phosphate-dependent enzyme [Propionibacteriaceae bacterium]
MPEEHYRVILRDDEVPTQWYNIVADLPTPPAPPLHPGTGQPLEPGDLAALFPPQIIEQEMSTQRWIDIPDPVREIYRLWRPSPLYRAHRLEKALDTTAHIYYKYEGVSPVGSHKTNSSVPQAYYNMLAGNTRLTTETGAGQWGAALAFAAEAFGLSCDIWQVRASYESKPYRAAEMSVFGGTVVASPSELTQAGRALREQFPDTTGSLGMAISEAVEAAAGDPQASYCLGSVLNHVLMHQTVIGQEAVKQLALCDEPGLDYLFACAGGGSNLAGISFPFIRENLEGRQEVRIVACEPSACPSLTEGEFRYDFGDTAGMTPQLKMYTLGHDFVPAAVHAGGLRYHGMAPLVSHCYHEGLIGAIAIGQREAFEAGVMFARAEGIIPASESNHAIAGALRQIRATPAGEKPVILIGVSGSGLLDLPAYTDYLSGTMPNT